jgi:hypothetical protein
MGAVGAPAYFLENPCITDRATSRNGVNRLKPVCRIFSTASCVFSGLAARDAEPSRSV